MAVKGLCCSRICSKCFTVGCNPYFVIKCLKIVIAREESSHVAKDLIRVDKVDSFTAKMSFCRICDATFKKH